MQVYHYTLDKREDVPENALYTQAVKDHVSHMKVSRNDLKKEFYTYSDAQLLELIAIGDRAVCELYERRKKKSIQAINQFMMGGLVILLITLFLLKSLGVIA